MNKLKRRIAIFYHTRFWLEYLYFDDSIDYYKIPDFEPQIISHKIWIKEREKISLFPLEYD
jgi:hypothetical protein